jgi:hypothetical protein
MYFPSKTPPPASSFLLIIIKDQQPSQETHRKYQTVPLLFSLPVVP